MHEDESDLLALQATLDASLAEAGPHLRGIITPATSATAHEIVHRLHGMRLLVVATVSSDNRPFAGPVDGYFLRGSWYFSSGRNSLRMRHLARSPVVSASYHEGESFALTVHGTVELFDVFDPDRPQLREAMLAHYLPLQGDAFAEWLTAADPLGARIDAEKMFAFRLAD